MQIVAPAGSYDGLVASIKAGADAVYLGLPLFGARAKAVNFDEANLLSAVEYAHLFGVKVFVTLNTLIKDREMDRAVELAKFAYSSGVDAAIVQDLRFIKKVKHALPDFALHASTQMGIHNEEGARVLKDLGISRGVLARETLSRDIGRIKKTGLEIEYFVQGALCICFSGNCYFSSLASSYSGNRGKCMQLCRKPYIFSGNKGYHLSAKDLCLYDKLDLLEELGVDAIKIEGRMRSKEYAYRAVSVYKGKTKYTDPVEALKTAFNRGDFCDGYLCEDAPHRVIYSKSQGNIGVSIGKLTAVRGNVVECAGFIPHEHDGFKIMRDGFEICGAAEIGGKIIASGACRIGDELRRTFDGNITEELDDAKRLIDVDVTVSIEPDKALSAKIVCNGRERNVTGEFIAQPARNCGITDIDISSAFLKVSEYPFSPSIKADITGDAFVPKSALNEFRRQVYQAVKTDILDNYVIKRSDLPYHGLDYNKFDGKGKILMVDAADDLDKSVLSKIDYLALSPNDYTDFSIPDIDKPILLNMPVTMRDGDREILTRAINRPEIYGVISNNLYTLKLTDKPILLGTGHNIIGESEYPHITSFEADELGNGFVYAFGYAPVMTLCHCPYAKCKNCSGRTELKDEHGRSFTLRRIKAKHCYWQLLNFVPTYIDKPGTGNLLFDCTACKHADIGKIIDFDYSGKYTRGNLNKGLK